MVNRYTNLTYNSLKDLPMPVVPYEQLDSLLGQYDQYNQLVDTLPNIEFNYLKDKKGDEKLAQVVKNYQTNVVDTIKESAKSGNANDYLRALKQGVRELSRLRQANGPINALESRVKEKALKVKELKEFYKNRPQAVNPYLALNPTPEINYDPSTGTYNQINPITNTLAPVDGKEYTTFINSVIDNIKDTDLVMGLDANGKKQLESITESRIAPFQKLMRISKLTGRRFDDVLNIIYGQYQGRKDLQSDMMLNQMIDSYYSDPESFDGKITPYDLYERDEQGKAILDENKNPKYANNPLSQMLMGAAEGRARGEYKTDNIKVVNSYNMQTQLARDKARREGEALLKMATANTNRINRGLNIKLPKLNKDGSLKTPLTGSRGWSVESNSGEEVVFDFAEEDKFKEKIADISILEFNPYDSVKDGRLKIQEVYGRNGVKLTLSEAEIEYQKLKKLRENSSSKEEYKQKVKNSYKLLNYDIPTTINETNEILSEASKFIPAAGSGALEADYPGIKDAYATMAESIDKMRDQGNFKQANELLVNAYENRMKNLNNYSIKYYIPDVTASPEEFAAQQKAINNMSKHLIDQGGINNHPGFYELDPTTMVIKDQMTTLDAIRKGAEEGAEISFLGDMTPANTLAPSGNIYQIGNRQFLGVKENNEDAIRKAPVHTWLSSTFSINNEPSAPAMDSRVANHIISKYGMDVYNRDFSKGLVAKTEEINSLTIRQKEADALVKDLATRKLSTEERQRIERDLEEINADIEQLIDNPHTWIEEVGKVRKPALYHPETGEKLLDVEETEALIQILSQ